MNQVIKLIAKNQLDKAFEAASKFFEETSENYNDFILLRKRYSKIKGKNYSGIVEEKDEIEELKITKILLELISDFEPQNDIHQLQEQIQSQIKLINSLKKEKDELVKKIRELEIKSSPRISTGIDHINSSILPYYLTLNIVTINDLKSAMDEILNQIISTTIVINNENNARLGLFEVLGNGRFRVLAQKNISPRRVVDLEENFSHDTRNPKGVIGYCIANEELIFCSELRGSKYEEWYYLTDYNMQKRRHEANGIICIPIFDESMNRNGKVRSNAVAVLSVSVSKEKFFTEKHLKGLKEYCTHIKYIYKALKSRIIYDPRSLELITGITVSGKAGSGKSTLVIQLLNSLKSHGWQEFQINHMFSKFCDIKGIQDEKGVEYLPDELHMEFDEFQRDILIEHKGIIVESRFSGIFAKEQEELSKRFISVYLDCPVSERIKRYSKKLERKSIKYISEKVDELDRLNFERSKKLYDKSYTDKSIYDLYLDSRKTPDEMAIEILDKIKLRALNE
ncbi:MAG: cytidylate kinase family protein [Chitinophagales bacterium]|nr:cytidylate kinase family protein [Chitinophagales bacterium]